MEHMHEMDEDDDLDWLYVEEDYPLAVSISGSLPFAVGTLQFPTNSFGDSCGTCP